MYRYQFEPTHQVQDAVELRELVVPFLERKEPFLVELPMSDSEHGNDSEEHPCWIGVLFDGSSLAVVARRLIFLEDLSHDENSISDVRYPKSAFLTQFRIPIHEGTIDTLRQICSYRIPRPYPLTVQILDRYREDVLHQYTFRSKYRRSLTQQMVRYLYRVATNLEKSVQVRVLPDWVSNHPLAQKVIGESITRDLDPVSLKTGDPISLGSSLPLIRDTVRVGDTFSFDQVSIRVFNHCRIRWDQIVGIVRSAEMQLLDGRFTIHEMMREFLHDHLVSEPVPDTSQIGIRVRYPVRLAPEVLAQIVLEGLVYRKVRTRKSYRVAEWVHEVAETQVTRDQTGQSLRKMWLAQRALELEPDTPVWVTTMVHHGPCSVSDALYYRKGKLVTSGRMNQSIRSFLYVDRRSQTVRIDTPMGCKEFPIASGFPIAMERGFRCLTDATVYQEPTTAQLYLKYRGLEQLVAVLRLFYHASDPHSVSFWYRVLHQLLPRRVRLDEYLAFLQALHHASHIPSDPREGALWFCQQYVPGWGVYHSEAVRNPISTVEQDLRVLNRIFQVHS